jgi:hypothetical protein
MPEPSLTVSFDLDGAEPGVDDDPGNPLARALARLLGSGPGSGGPFERIRLCFCLDRSRDPHNPMLRRFGILVLSTAGRVIFFPGFGPKYDRVEAHHSGRMMWNEEFAFDHVSLEPDLRHWHITTPGSTSHRGGPRTLSLGDGQYLWFGLSMNSLDELHPVKQRTSVQASPAESDMHRRVEVLRKAREEAEFPMIDWNLELYTGEPPGFWHFALIVASPPGTPYAGGTLGFPIGSPYLSAPMPQGYVRLAVRSHDVDLTAGLGVQVTTCGLPGRLSVPIVFTAPGTQP